MQWAACCTAFFGFLAPWRIYLLPDSHNIWSCVVSFRCWGGLALQSFICFCPPMSHQDRHFGVGTTVHLGWVEGPVCPVKAILAYLALRGPFPGRLIIFQDQSLQSRLNLVRAVWFALESQGLDICCFISHSFRIGAATTAVACGIEHSLIQALGRWKLSALQPIFRLLRTYWFLSHPFFSPPIDTRHLLVVKPH